MIYSLFDYADRVAGENKSPFVNLPYLHKFCEALQDCVCASLPNGAKNLACCIAPRHYKTSFGSRAFPAWCLAEVAPDCEFILTSYSESLVTDSAVAIRKIITQPWHMDLYPHLRISGKDRDLQRYFKTTAGGSVYAAPIGGVITSFGAGKVRRGFGGAIIIDDTMKANEAKSPVMRQNVIDFYNNTLKSRRNSVHNTPIILIAQRLHPQDLLGWILEHEPEDWHVLSFPAIQNGKPLNPLTTSMEFLEKLKEVAPHTYWSQYMQSPIAQGGNIIKLGWWKTYKPQLGQEMGDKPSFANGFEAGFEVGTGIGAGMGTESGFAIDPESGPEFGPKPGPEANTQVYSKAVFVRGPNKGGLIFLTADTAYKSKSSSDASVIRAWEGTREHLYCLDAVYGRWEFPYLLEQAQAFWEKWVALGAREFWVEDKASGTPLAQTLRSNGIPAEDWKPSDFDFPDDKVGRMNEAAWAVHGGHVLLPEGPESVVINEGDEEIRLYVDAQSKVLMEECAAFSADMSHAHDDHCDTLTMALSIWRSAGGQGGPSPCPAAGQGIPG